MAMICPRCSELFPDDAAFCPHDGSSLTKNTDRFLGKTLAARYHLTKKLGSGGMSLVYLARHELISRLSAIKILRPELSRIPEHRERFLREARAVNRINHENIVEISDVGESDGVAYLVMEYVEGESLLAQIQKGPMPWDRASRIAVQVASALARTHQTGIIHRDLKPENILLLPHASARYSERIKDGAPLEVTPAVEQVKLTDFGIAKMMGEPTLTLNEQLFGTPGYIAPEYVEGQEIDGRADLYSLAVVVYEMVTGVLPFEGRGQSDLLLKPLTSAPIPPSRRVQGLPPDFEALLLRGLAREPAERPRDAFQFQDQLLDILRRYGGSVSQILVAPEATHGPRAPIETVVDQPAGTGSDTANVGKLATKEMSSRWSTALAELESEIARARRAGGSSAVVAGRAAELALVAGEMVPRIARASKFVGSLQAKVDRLEAIGREFRTNLGHAIDVLAHDRSRERAHLDALRTRRKELDKRAAAAVSGAASGAPADSDPQPWEIAALNEEEKRAEDVVTDLHFQVDVLQKQLDRKNEEHETALTEASGSLEGALSAVRRLTNEIARTIDDGIAMLQESRR